jgi:predicted nucleotidyltransferase
MSSIASSAIPAAALTIAQRLSASLEPDRIWLFGSHARGDATPDSDLDFLVVIPQSADSRYHRAVKARAMVTELRVPKDIIVLTREEWTNELRVPSSLASTVLREGVSLYGS